MITTGHGTMAAMTASEIAGLVRQVELNYDHGLISMEEARRTLNMCWEPVFGRPFIKSESPPATASEAEALPAVEVPGGEDPVEQARRGA